MELLKHFDFIQDLTYYNYCTKHEKSYRYDNEGPAVDVEKR